MVEIRQTATIPEKTEDRILAILAAEAKAAGHPFRGEVLTFEAWEGETFLGGLTARLGVDWLCIDLLAVVPVARGHGIGGQLVRRAEAFARARGMTGVWVDSFTFQAPEFYHRLGFAEIGRIEHYPRNQARVFLAKRFPEVPLVRRLRPEDDCASVLGLIRENFAYMVGRIDPPSSVHRLTAEGVARQAAEGEVWLLETEERPVGSIFLTSQNDALYIGKLAVAGSHRRRGLARRLIGLAEDRAGAMGLPRLRLQTRVELTENHAAFAAMGFIRTGETSHEGYDRPTSVMMEKPLTVTDE